MNSVEEKRIMDLLEQKIIKSLEEQQKQFEEMKHNEFLRESYEYENQNTNYFKFKIDRFNLYLNKDITDNTIVFFGKVLNPDNEWYNTRIPFKDVVSYDCDTKTGKYKISGSGIKWI